MRTGHAARRKTRSATDPSLNPPPPSSTVGFQNDDIDFPGVGMKNHAGGITVLLFDAHLHACRLCAFPKMGEVFEPLACARGESNVGRGCMKQQAAWRRRSLRA